MLFLWVSWPHLGVCLRTTSVYSALYGNFSCSRPKNKIPVLIFEWEIRLCINPEYNSYMFIGESRMLWVVVVLLTVGPLVNTRGTYKVFVQYFV